MCTQLFAPVSHALERGSEITRLWCLRLYSSQAFVFTSLAYLFVEEDMLFWFHKIAASWAFFTADFRKPDFGKQVPPWACDILTAVTRFGKLHSFRGNLNTRTLMETNLSHPMICRTVHSEHLSVRVVLGNES